MATKTANFNKSDLQKMYNEIKAAETAYEGAAEHCAVAGGIGIWFTLISGGTGAPLIITLGVLSSIGGAYYTMVSNAAERARDTVQTYLNFLNSNSRYNLVELRVTYDTKNYDGKQYLIPSDIVALRCHCTDPTGWVTV